ncbi:uncharacterized protein LOC115629669 isoform X2 [Scaptodrosophila lebanonensis]|uniref:Uncharacterized protein LOC115629669 isoform X2 n=1 Tax=Drosophila lebanonensis TaxID=7225 RepID=A0A6J2U4I5_DROLE|nr:uncharacterized protein LOC115629669 isoform X2 [Scaptodrosophila lebanonensis]
MSEIADLLTSMASTFNSDCATSTAEGGTLLNRELAEDKTVKWRNLANNQFACKDKEKKQQTSNNNNNSSSNNASSSNINNNNNKCEDEATAKAAVVVCVESKAEVGAELDTKQTTVDAQPQDTQNDATVTTTTNAAVAAAVQLDKAKDLEQDINITNKTTEQSTTSKSGKDNLKDEILSATDSNVAAVENKAEDEKDVKLKAATAGTTETADELSLQGQTSSEGGANATASAETKSTVLAMPALATTPTPTSAEPIETSEATAKATEKPTETTAADDAKQTAEAESTIATATTAAGVDGDGSDDNAAATTKTSHSLVKLEQETEATLPNAAAAADAAGAPATTTVATSTEGIKTEKELPEEEQQHKQEEKKQTQQEEQQVRVNEQTLTLTTTDNNNVKSTLAAAAAASAALTAAIPELAPLVVNSVAGGADATDSNDDIAATAANAAAAECADKNEQNTAANSRRLRRTPRPTDTTTPTPTATASPTPTTQPQQETERAQSVNKVESLPGETSEAVDVKKEPEKGSGTTNNSSGSDDVAGGPTATATSPPPAPKRGRGRTKKIKMDADQTNVESSCSEAVPTTEEPAESSSPPAVERKVGRKRKQPEEDVSQQLGDVVVKTETDEDAATPKDDPKKMRRSVRLGNKDHFKPVDGHGWEELKTEKEPLATVAGTVADLANTELTSTVILPRGGATTVLDEKTPPKKRGRKAKIPATVTTTAATATVTMTVSAAALTKTEVVQAIPSKHSLTPTGNSPLSNGSKRVTTSGAEAVQLPKRSKRRIKPTPKILANDELRCEFETKHIERMTHWEAAGTPGSSGNMGDGHFETPPQHPCGGNSSSSTSRQKSERSDGSGVDSQHPAGSNAIKKRLFKSSRDIKNSDAALWAKSQIPPCPDVDEFLSEIKASKLNANRSPEERKLNKKQLRKLAKQKEKHLKHLGLQRNNSGEASDNDSSNTDNEEFVPTIRVHVGKPSVTLRLRNTSKETSSTMTTATQPKTALAPPQPAAPKVPRRVGAGVGRPPKYVDVAASEPSATVDHSQLHSLNSTILAAAGGEAAATLPNVSSKSGATKFICLCQKSSQYYARNAPDASYCCAIDNIDEQKIGCCNELSAEVHNLLRPSQRVGYMILCDEHKKRLQSHNCCAGCGIFCTQQSASSYTSPILVLKCPHCGVDTPERTSTVTMKCQTLPVFLPTQKSKIKPAKLTTSAHLSQFSASSANGSNKSGSKGAGGGRSKSGNKNNGTRSKASATSAGHNQNNTINFEQLIPESVMNVVLRGRMVSASGRVTTEFTSGDMYYAVQNDDLERVAEILAADYNVLTRMREFQNGTCLHLVAHSGTLQMAYLLLCKGASSQDFINIVDNDLRTATMCAVMNDKCDILNLFVQCGADVSIKGPDGKTSLHIAAKLGNLEATKLIVESYRASRNIASFLSFIDAQDEGGWTAMVWAAELGHTDIVSLLLNHGADPNICDNDNNTVLHWSTLHNDGLETITVLLQAGADCNVQNVEGDTPLHIACRHSVTRMCIALIANGADLMIKNKAEQLPFDCIPNEESECGRTVGFNMQMRSFRPLGLRTRVVCADVSNGREVRPIQAVRNELTMSEHEDEADTLMLPDFKYITKCIILQNSVQIDSRVSQMRICSCLDSCSSDMCQCNGASSQNWYTAESRLICEFNYDDPAVIFECNDVCGCNKLSCKNRVVQNGIRTPLQIVECEESVKGWGVRALANVPKGTYVANYAGEILTEHEADRRTDDSYYYDLDNGHCIDANYYGNVSRFFNHSCEPNILPVRVFYEHQDYRFPKIAFFACRDIDAGEEICYDYGDKFWRAEQRSGGCRCLAPSCKYTTQTPSSNASPTASLGNDPDVMPSIGAAEGVVQAFA